MEVERVYKYMVDTEEKRVRETDRERARKKARERANERARASEREGERGRKEELGGGPSGECSVCHVLQGATRPHATHKHTIRRLHSPHTRHTHVRTCERQCAEATVCTHVCHHEVLAVRREEREAERILAEEREVGVVLGARHTQHAQSEHNAHK